MILIKNLNTGKIEELEYGNPDFLVDILDGAGIPICEEEDKTVYALDSDELDWWRRWIARQERIDEEINNLDYDEREMILNLVDFSDVERAQDELERLLWG